MKKHDILLRSQSHCILRCQTIRIFRCENFRFGWAMSAGSVSVESLKVWQTVRASKVPMVSDQKAQWTAVRTCASQTDMTLNSCKLRSFFYIRTSSHLALGLAERPDLRAQERVFPLKKPLFRALERWRAKLPGLRTAFPCVPTHINSWLGCFNAVDVCLLFVCRHLWNLLPVSLHVVHVLEPSSHWPQDVLAVNVSIADADLLIWSIASSGTC